MPINNNARTSTYPCPPEKVGLNVIPEIRKRYGEKISIGFSDHTSGFNASIAAVALGATVIEKHFTFSKYMYGSDAALAMEPNEFKILTAELKSLWITLENHVNKDDLSNVKDMKNIFEKVLYRQENLKKDQELTFKDMAFKKPGIGIPTKEYNKLIGLKLKYNIPKDHMFDYQDFMRNICIVVGSRANYSSIKSAMIAIKEHNKLNLQLILTASAVLDRYGLVSETIKKDGFSVDESIYTILEGETPVTMAKSTGLGLIELSSAFERLKP